MGNEIHHRKEGEEPQGASNPANLGGLLGEILGEVEAGAAQNNPPPAASNPPQGGDQVLGTLGGASNAPMMGQSAPQSAPAPAPNAEGDLGGLLGALLGGGASQGAGGDLGGLLGSLLGGAGAGTAPDMSGQGTDAMGGLLGGLLGGMTGGTSGASPNMAGAGNMGNMNGLLTPLADALADKLGIRRDVALAAMTIIVPIVLNKLMSSGQQQSGGNPLAGLQSGQGLNFTKSEHDHMVSQLATQTGLSHHEASQTISQAIQVLGAQ